MKSFERFKKDLEEAIRKDIPSADNIVINETAIIVDGNVITNNSMLTVKEAFDNIQRCKLYNGISPYAEFLAMTRNLVIIKLIGHEGWFKRGRQDE